MTERIYFDNSATTKICEKALERYIEISRECYGNPSSLHSLGFDAERILSSARESVRKSLGAKDSDVIFTASGSEANNLAIIGRALSKERYRTNGKILISDGEHASVGECAAFLRTLGFTVAQIPTRGGAIDLSRLEKELTPNVILVSMMMVNNETGALYDIPTVARMMKAHSPESYLHVDATQSYMKIPFTKASIGADMITLSSHKIEGPKGVGALLVDKKVTKAKGLAPLILGGGQEGGLRSGTENVPAIAAFAMAIDESSRTVRDRYSYCNELREYILGHIKSDEDFSGVIPIEPESHAPHILNLILPGIKSETMLHFLSSYGIFVSSGSACSSNTRHLSPALLAYGVDERSTDFSIRVSLSHRNTKEEADKFLEALSLGIRRLARR